MILTWQSELSLQSPSHSSNAEAVDSVSAGRVICVILLCTIDVVDDEVGFNTFGNSLRIDAGLMALILPSHVP